MPPVSARQELKPAQQRALAVLRDGRRAELTRGGYQELARVSRSQAAYDLAELVEAGVLERIGRGRSTRYVLAKQPNLTRRRWTSERIRAELASFCDGGKTWPSAREFKAAGHADLYVAASRYGGVAFWAAELGLDRGGRRWEKPSIARLKLSLSWATIGALGGALAVGAAVAVVQRFPGAAPEKVAEHAGSATTAKGTPGQNSTRRPRTTVKRATTAKVRAHAPAKTSHPAVVKPTASAATAPILAVRTVSVSPPPPSRPVSSTTSSSGTRATTTASSTASGGPTPLMAPRGGSSTPPPLPPPTH